MSDATTLVAIAVFCSIKTDFSSKYQILENTQFFNQKMDLIKIFCTQCTQIVQNWKKNVPNFQFQ